MVSSTLCINHVTLCLVKQMDITDYKEVDNLGSSIFKNKEGV